MICTIYSFQNKINGKRYIGSTIQKPERRYNQHITTSKNLNDPKSQYPLYQAFRKYGIDNFLFENLFQEEMTKQEIRKIEQEYILKYNTLCPNGYNQTLDTDLPFRDDSCHKKSGETKREKAKRVAEIDKNNNILHIWRCMADCYEETGLSQSHMTACCNGQRHTVGGRRFCYLDELNKPIIKEYVGNTYKGEPGTTKKSKNNKRVVKLDKNTEEILAVYDSIALAGRENSCCNSSIAKVCKGDRKYKTAGGFKWKYADE